MVRLRIGKQPLRAEIEPSKAQLVIRAFSVTEITDYVVSSELMENSRVEYPHSDMVDPDVASLKDK